MAASPESIADLQRQLAETRAHLTRTTSDLGASLDVPARVRQKVAAHPWKWALLAVAGGVVAAKTLPLALSLVRTAGSRRLVGTLLTAVGPVALRAGLNALATHRPDLAAFLHRQPDPPPAEDPPHGT
jgi:Protein of unknown function (DUF3618)